MTTQWRALVGVLTLLVAAGASPASAFDPNTTFAKGAFVLSAEGGYGQQMNVEGFSATSDMEFWNVGLRASLLPLGPAGPSILRGALEVGLEPFYQRYMEPEPAFWAGLAAVGRYHFLSLGRVVPYVELGIGAGGTDLNVLEIDSTFSFLIWGGLGVSVFVTDSTAIYAGYRWQHNSNGNTDVPNRGWESSVAVLGVSYYFR
jgi:lipid A 3-O-deacylase